MTILWLLWLAYVLAELAITLGKWFRHRQWKSRLKRELREEIALKEWAERERMLRLR